MMKSLRNKNVVLTIDLEDWFHSLDYPPENWGKYERRIEYSTRKILAFLSEKKSKATFFVLGEVAEKHPDLIKEIYGEGHEIGSHSYYHKFIYKQTKIEFRDDLNKSINLLSDLIGEKISCFRAPYFSITNKCIWAFDILKGEGIECDSSIFPVLNHRYGIPNYTRLPIKLENGIWEWPISTFSTIFGNIPFSGGVYFRFLPAFISRYFTTSLMKRSEPVLFYFHPWEFDPNQPKINKFSSFLNFRHYYGLDRNFEKFISFIEDFNTITISKGKKELQSSDE